MCTAGQREAAAEREVEGARREREAAENALRRADAVDPDVPDVRDEPDAPLLDRWRRTAAPPILRRVLLDPQRVVCLREEQPASSKPNRGLPAEDAAAAAADAEAVAGLLAEAAASARADARDQHVLAGGDGRHARSERDRVADGFVPEDRARLQVDTPLQDVQVGAADLEVVIALGGARIDGSGTGDCVLLPTEAAGGDLPDRSIDSGSRRVTRWRAWGSEE